MAMQTITGWMTLPEYKRVDLTPMAGGTVGILLDAPGEKMAVILRAPKAGDLAKVWFRTGTVTTGDTLKVSFQTVDDATGFPDEVVDQYRTVVIADANDNTGFLTGIISSDGTDGGVKRTVTKNEKFAVVFEYNSYVAGNMYLSFADGLGASGAPQMPYVAQKVGAGPTWAKGGSATMPCIAIEYSDGTYDCFGTLPIQSHTNVTYGSATATADEYAMVFTLPFACRIAGMGAVIDLDGDADFILYEGTTVRASVSLDTESDRSMTSTGVLEVLFDAAYDIAANTTYRIAVKPTTASTVLILTLEFASAALMDSVEGGSDFYKSSRVDAGAWDGDDTARRPAFWLLISGVDVSAGGGLAANPIGGFIG